MIRVRRCEFCDSPVPADAIRCPICGEEIAEETLERILPLLKRPEAPEIRVMGTFERLWSVIRRPAAAYRDIAQRPDNFGPFLIILFNALILTAVFLAVSSKLSMTVPVYDPITNSTQPALVNVLSTEYGGMFYTASLVTIMPNIMIGMVYLIVGSGFAHLAFKIAGGTGRKRKTISIVGYSMLPVVIFRLLAIAVVFIAMPSIEITSIDDAVQAVGFVYGSGIWLTIDIMTTIAFVWTGFLLIFGIREAHDTSTVWAFLVSAASVVILALTFWQIH